MVLILVGADSTRRVNCEHVRRMMSCAGWILRQLAGIPDPPIDANPMFARSNTLAFWKKALSFFMPDRLVLWVSGHNEGNPMRSVEVQKQGALLKAKHPLTEAEFWKIQKILQNHNKNNVIWRFGLYSLTNLMFHMVAGIDDTTAQVYIENIQVHD